MPEMVLDLPMTGSLTPQEIRLAKDSCAAWTKLGWSPSLPVELVAASGDRIPLPSSVVTMIRFALDQMAEGHAVQVQPVRHRTPGLEHWTVTDAEAEHLQALLESPANSAGRIQREPKSIPLGNASLLN